jgi:hypothetical protein
MYDQEMRDTFHIYVKTPDQVYLSQTLSTKRQSQTPDLKTHTDALLRHLQVSSHDACRPDETFQS